MLTVYQIAFAPARKPYREGLLFRHNIGDFYVILFCNVAKQDQADFQSVESHIGKGSHYSR